MDYRKRVLRSYGGFDIGERKLSCFSNNKKDRVASRVARKRDKRFAEREIEEWAMYKGE